MQTAILFSTPSVAECSLSYNDNKWYCNRPLENHYDPTSATHIAVSWFSVELIPAVPMIPAIPAIPAIPGIPVIPTIPTILTIPMIPGVPNNLIGPKDSDGPSGSSSPSGPRGPNDPICFNIHNGHSG